MSNIDNRFLIYEDNITHNKNYYAIRLSNIETIYWDHCLYINDKAFLIKSINENTHKKLIDEILIHIKYGENDCNLNEIIDEILNE